MRLQDQIRSITLLAPVALWYAANTLLN